MTAVCFNGEKGGRCLHGRVFGVSIVSVQCFVFSFIEREKKLKIKVDGIPRTGEPIYIRKEDR